MPKRPLTPCRHPLTTDTANHLPHAHRHNHPLFLAVDRDCAPDQIRPLGHRAALAVGQIPRVDLMPWIIAEDRVIANRYLFDDVAGGIVDRQRIHKPPTARGRLPY